MSSDSRPLHRPPSCRRHHEHRTIRSRCLRLSCVSHLTTDPHGAKPWSPSRDFRVAPCTEPKFAEPGSGSGYLEPVADRTVSGFGSGETRPRDRRRLARGHRAMPSTSRETHPEFSLPTGPPQHLGRTANRDGVPVMPPSSSALSTYGASCSSPRQPSRTSKGPTPEGVYPQHSTSGRELRQRFLEFSLPRGWKAIHCFPSRLPVRP